ncbi:MAG: hypothetical protein Q9184_005140 [Pyrenodesmia sp. 2 TL-2023]
MRQRFRVNATQVIETRYRSLTPKARLIPLTAPFLSYLRADGILLPLEETDADPFSSTETDSGIFSSTSTPTGSPTNSDSDSDIYTDPSLSWPEIHSAVASTIGELGGNVVPKLNWSAPKDATWINATHTMECRSPNDVYLLLKSSDFVTHDLEQAFDGCSPSPSPDNAIESNSNNNDTIPYHLILRKTIPALATSLEFRCFVRARTLLCVCQRDLNHYDFLPNLTGTLRLRIQAFFEESLKGTFEDENWVFDVYIPPPHRRVWLIDVNPWAPRTDPLLFSWMEILGMRVPGLPAVKVDNRNGAANVVNGDGGSETEGTNEEEEEGVFTPEFRLVGRNDPEAYSFNTPQYSAHKMPKDVVDASGDGEAGLREFMGRWREIVKEQEEGERGEER